MRKFSTIIIRTIFIYLIFTTCTKSESDLPNTAPEAFFVVSPWSGSTSTQFNFDASYSTDKQDDDSLLVVRWDWENNETWDTDWSVEKQITHQFTPEGKYTIKLEVKDSDGLTHSVTQDIFVDNTGNEWLGKPCYGTETVTYGEQVYNTVKIGSQCWFAENLNYETGISYCYAHDTAYCNTYGRLYTWETALNACPDGWHLPSDEEWKVLEGYVDAAYDEGDPEWDRLGLRGYDAGKHLKTTTGWYPNDNGTDKYNFGGMPGGYGQPMVYHQHLGIHGFWWTSTTANDTKARYRHLANDQYLIGRNSADQGLIMSVRCLKDD